MINWSFDLGSLVSIATVIGGGLSAFAFQRASVQVAISKAEEAYELANCSRDDLAAFKQTVAEKYIRSDDLNKMEHRLVASEARMMASLESLASRIDALIDRMDRNTR